MLSINFNKWTSFAKVLIHQVIPFEEKRFLSLCCIVKNTEWNGIILPLKIEDKYTRIILSLILMDLVVF